MLRQIEDIRSKRACVSSFTNGRDCNRNYDTRVSNLFNGESYSTEILEPRVWILLDIDRKYAQVEHSATTRHAGPYDKYQTFSLFVSADASDRGETRRAKTFVGSVGRMIDDDRRFHACLSIISVMRGRQRTINAYRGIRIDLTLSSQVVESESYRPIVKHCHNSPPLRSTRAITARSIFNRSIGDSQDKAALSGYHRCDRERRTKVRRIWPFPGEAISGRRIGRSARLLVKERAEFVRKLRGVSSYPTSVRRETKSIDVEEEAGRRA